MVAAESCKFGAVVTSLAPASLSSHRHLPGKRVSSSAALDWDSSLVEVIEQPSVATEFTTPATPDLLVVMGLLGPLQVQSRVGGRWQAAQYHSGTIGLTAPGSSDTLRWHMINSSPRMTLHVHLPSELLETTRADLPRAARIADLDALDLKDLVAAAILRALHSALRRQAEAVVADSLAQALAAQLLSPSTAGAAAQAIASGGLSQRAMNCVVDYMHAHLPDQIALADLAKQVHLSKFHFLRAFKASVGMTPHRYLTELRMQRAVELLASQRHTVSAIASLCGYASVGRFTAVFRQHYGVPPSSYYRL